MSFRSLFLTGLLFGITTCGVTSAFAATLTVNNGSIPNSPCVGQYPSITAGLAAAQSGDTVFVCAGVYNEQVVITQPVSLVGQSGARMQPANMVVNADDYGTPVAAVIVVSGVASPGVTVSGLIIDGSQNNLNSGCATDIIGIYYTNSSGTIVHNAVEFIELSAGDFGCQVGLPIYANNPAGAANTVNIEVNSVHDFQKNGITVNDAGLATNISGNIVTGSGPTPVIAQNGIQLAYSATGTISSNIASGFVYSACVSVANCSYSSTGILTYDSGTVSISGNTLGQSQGAIYVYTADSTNNPLPTNATVSSNRISNSLVYDGIAVFGNSANITSNTVVASSESGINLFGNTNQVTKNTIIDAPVGVLLSSGTGSVISGSKYFAVVQTVQTVPQQPVRNPAPHARPKR